MHKFTELIKHLRSIDLPTRIIFWLVFFVLLMIPFKIFSYDFWPKDDANRHIAKVISGKSWDEILVMNPNFQGFDHNMGWHEILSAIHKLGVNADGLMLFSCIGLFILFVVSGLFLFQKQPLAWVTTLVFAPFISNTDRWMFGRPYMFSAFCLFLLLGLWHRSSFSLGVRWGVSVGLFMLASWIHGAWYLFLLLPLSFFFTGKIEKMLQSGSAWVAGAFLAGLLSGDPIFFLIKQVQQTIFAVGAGAITRVLVAEFQPTMMMMPVLFLIILIIITHINTIPFNQITTNPGFWLAILGWVLGMSNGRFWWDWGTIGYLYLIAEIFNLLLQQEPFSQYTRNFVHVGLSCLCIYLIFTNDINSRWSNNGLRDRLTLENPDHVEWLPEPGGILYSDTMRAYYETFYENPHGDWRYILGHEPALMPAEDLKIYRKIQFYNRNSDVYEPWIKKMSPKDRFITYKKMDIPELEWEYVGYYIWSGRLPKTTKALTD